jgi:hypothetical protein
MEKLTATDGLLVPGAHESWDELAEHSVAHDQLSTTVHDPGTYARFVAQRRALWALAVRAA